MTTAQLKKLEKTATESLSLARRAFRKSNEIETLLSYLQYKAGNVRAYNSVDELFKKLARV